jgi:hypothetical protein
MDEAQSHRFAGILNERPLAFTGTSGLSLQLVSTGAKDPANTRKFPASREWAELDKTDLWPKLAAIGRIQKMPICRAFMGAAGFEPATSRV